MVRIDKMQLQNKIETFFALVRAGLCEKEVQLLPFGEIDFSEICRLAEEQSVVGLIAAGLEHCSDVKVPQEVGLNMAGSVLQLEQRNIAMNSFVEKLYGEMQRMNIYSILVKGQGIAQCYKRPLWRVPGDVDLLLNEDEYERAKEWVGSFGHIIEDENKFKKHILYRVNSWDVELHGTLRGELGGRIDKTIDEVQNDIFYGGSVRSWLNGTTTIFLPAPDNDVIFVFAHILQHFFRGGIGLRQICDWCRLLWTYRETLDLKLLESRIKKAGIMSEWHAFAVLAVDTLGMPEDAVPFYSPAMKWKRKSRRICHYVMEVGNFGFNRDLSYKSKSSFLIRMIKSLRLRTGDFIKQVRVFPLDSVRAFFYVWKTGFNVVGRKLKE